MGDGSRLVEKGRNYDMLTDYIAITYVFSPGAGLRIRRLGVRLLLGVFCFVRHRFCNPQPLFAI